MPDAEEPVIPLLGDLSGRLLEGRYQVKSVLGSGGMGTAYLAHDVRMRRDVVVKVPHVHFLMDKGFRERFLREVESLTRLPHPSIVKALDTGALQGVPYAVLEYLPGGNLKERILAAGGRQAPDEVRAWLVPVAEALDYIHKQGVVHRDVKPGNVLFDAAGHVFLADFGIAKALSSADTGITQTGMTPGSPDYMAPEAVLHSRLTPVYDQYALGTMVYEALSGRLPHKGETPMAVMFQKHAQPVPPLTDVAPHLSPAVAGAVMRALEKDPQARFPSCSAFAEAFAAALTESPAASTRLPKDAERTVGPARAAPEPPRRATRVTAARERAPEPPASPPTGRRRSTWALGAVALVGVGLGAWWLFGRQDPASAPSAKPGGGSGPASEAEPSLAIETPRAGDVVARAIQVRGRAAAPLGWVLRVNEREVRPAGDGTFEATVEAVADGPFEVRAAWSAPPTRARALGEPAAPPPSSPVKIPAPAQVRLLVDGTAPAVTLLSPAAERTLVAASAFTVRGQVAEAHLDGVTVQGKPVTVDAGGAFTAEIEVPEDAPVEVLVEARDKAGNTGRSPRRIVERDLGGRTALHTAAAAGNLARVVALLSGGADANAADVDRVRPLHLAVAGGHADVARALLDKGADVDARALAPLVPERRVVREGSSTTTTRLIVATPLHLALWTGREDLVVLLLERKADLVERATVEYVYEPQSGGTSCGLQRSASLLLARVAERAPLLAALDRRGIDVDDPALVGDESTTAWAAGAGEHALLDALLAEPAKKSPELLAAVLRRVVARGEKDLGPADWLGLARRVLGALPDEVRRKTATQALGSCATVGAARVLIDAGVDVAAEGGRALVDCADAEDLGLVPLLLEKGADPKATDSYGNTGLRTAAGAGRLETVRLLLDRGTDVHAKDEGPLQAAASSERLDVVKELLARGAKPTPEVVVSASWSGKGVEALRMVLDAGGDPKAATEYVSAVGAAASADRAEALALLLDRGADPRSVGLNRSSTETPLYRAIGAGAAKAVAVLLGRGLLLTESGRDPSALLVAGASSQRLDLLRLLIERGLSVKGDGAAAGVAAVRAGRLDAVDLLVSAGLDLVKALGGHLAESSQAFVSQALADRLRAAGVPPYEVASAALRSNAREVALRLLTDALAVPDPEGAGRQAVLATAFRHGQSQIFARLLAAAPSEANARDLPLAAGLVVKTQRSEVDPATSLLHLLPYAGTPGDVADLLLAAGLDPRTPDGKGLTPLHHAVTLAEVRPCRLLLAAGALPDAEDGQGITPIQLACSRRRVDAVRVLLERGARADRLDVRDATLLHLAAEAKDASWEVREGSPALFRLLLEKGVKVDAVTFRRETALHVTAKRGEGPLVRTLLEAGADPNAKDWLGVTPLHLAAEVASGKAVEVLLAAKADVKARDLLGKTPLHEAQGESLSRLLDAGADPTAQSADGSTVLHVIARERYGGEDVVKDIRLLSVKAKSLFDQRDGQGRVPLAVAVARGYEQPIETMLEFDANLGRLPTGVKGGPYSRPLTLLAQAVCSHSKAFVQRVLAAGAEAHDLVALQCSAWAYREEIFELLLSRGKFTPEELAGALKASSSDGRQALLRRGAKVPAGSPSGGDEAALSLEELKARLDATPGKTTIALHPYVYRFDLTAIRLLLDHGADVNGKDGSGRTPLGIYAFNELEKARKIVEELLSRGADPGFKGSGESTPLDAAPGNYVLGQALQEILLKRAGAKDPVPTANGLTWLHVAVRLDDGDAVRRLLREGAEPNATTKKGGVTPLHLAAEGRLSALRALLEGGAKVQVVDDAGRTPLHMAAAQSAEAVALLLAKGASAAAVDTEGHTPLHQAGSVGAVTALVAAGAPASAQDKERRTPLHAAAERNATAVVEALLKAGATVDALDAKGRTATLAAGGWSGYSAGPTLRALIAAGASPTARGEEGETVLHRAAQTSDVVLVRTLLAKGADPDARDKRGRSPLHLALDAYGDGSLAIARALLAAGAAVDARTTEGWTPLHEAADESPEKTWLVLAAKPQLTSADKEGRTALDVAARKSGENLTLRLLLAAGAVPTAARSGGAYLLAEVTEHGEEDLFLKLLDAGVRLVPADEKDATALHAAARTDQVERCRLLVKRGVAVDVGAGKSAGTPLQAAIKPGSLRAVQALLDLGAKVDAVDDDGVTPALLAVDAQRLDVLELLQARGASVRVKDKEGRGALHHWAWSDRTPGAETLLRALLKTGLAVDEKDGEGQTPSHRVCLQSDVEMLRLWMEVARPRWDVEDGNQNLPVFHMASDDDRAALLTYYLEHGGDANAANSKGLTALGVAAEDYDTARCLDVLLTHGADVKAKTKAGHTALHTAAYAGREKAIVRLVEAGADVEAKDESDWTPLFWAAKRDQDKAAAALLAAGARVNATSKTGQRPLDVAGSDTKPLIEAKGGTAGKAK